MKGIVGFAWLVGAVIVGLFIAGWIGVGKKA